MINYDSDRKRKIRIINTTIVIIVALLAVSGIIIAVINWKPPVKPDPYVFSSEQWKNGQIRERYKMLDDLLSKYDLYTMDREEIIELLGENEQKSQDSDVNYYFYYLGGEVMQAKSTLVIVFDESGKVINYEEVKDY